MIFWTHLNVELVENEHFFDFRNFVNHCLSVADFGKAVFQTAVELRLLCNEEVLCLKRSCVFWHNDNIGFQNLLKTYGWKDIKFVFHLMKTLRSALELYQTNFSEPISLIKRRGKTKSRWTERERSILGERSFTTFWYITNYPIFTNSSCKQIWKA